MENPTVYTKATPSKQFKKRIFIAYVAGLLDGEGSIFCLKFKGNARKDWNYSYRPVMTINNTHLGVLQFIQARWGGEIEETDTRGRKRMYRLKWIGRKILPIISKLQPLLIIKKEQASVMISLLRHIIEKDVKGGKILDEKDMLFREKAKQKLSLLNGQLQRLSEGTPLMEKQQSDTL